MGKDKRAKDKKAKDKKAKDKKAKGTDVQGTDVQGTEGVPDEEKGEQVGESTPHDAALVSDAALAVPPAPEASMPAGTGIVPILPCRDLDAALAYFIEELGFRIEVISPADGPRTALLSGESGMIRLERVSGDYQPAHVQVRCAEGDLRIGDLAVAPNGSRIEFVSAEPALVIPELTQELVVSTLAENAEFGQGRASMGYRDLVPDRQGGRFIASHIRIAQGGPVPDYVHFHKVRFQMIFVYRGWVKLVYEDQGDPFILHAGDCVLQPPTIRHRVLESSDGLEVIEIACPAEHETIAEHVIELPTGHTTPDRLYGGQRFVRHDSKSSAWTPFRIEGFVQQDLGISQATDGLAGARVIASAGGHAWPLARVPNEFLFTFLLDGSARLGVEGRQPQGITAGDCFVIPAEAAYGLDEVSQDARLLEVSLPADLQPVPA